MLNFTPEKRTESTVLALEEPRSSQGPAGLLTVGAPREGTGGRGHEKAVQGGRGRGALRCECPSLPSAWRWGRRKDPVPLAAG